MLSKQILFITIGLFSIASIPMEKPTLKGTVIILNGTSSVGKTSIINELKKVYGNTYEVLDVDTFIISYQATHPIKEQLESVALVDKKEAQRLRDSYYRTLLDSYYQFIKERSLKGNNIFVDTVLAGDKEYEQISNILRDINLIKILVYCPLDTTLRRVIQRNSMGKPEEQREFRLPIAQYPMIYKLKESPCELAVDKISSKDIKQLLRSSIDSAKQTLPSDKVEILEDRCKDFLTKLKLEELEEVVIAPRKEYDFIINSIYAPKDLAEQIVKFLKHHTKNI